MTSIMANSHLVKKLILHSGQNGKAHLLKHMGQLD